MLRGVQHNLFSSTSLDKLLNEINCSSVLKDGKIEAASVILVGNLICRLHQGLAESLMSVKHQRMVSSYHEFILYKNSGHIKQILD